MRLLAAEQAPDEGEIVVGPRVSPGFFTQLNARADLEGHGVLEVVEASTPPRRSSRRWRASRGRSSRSRTTGLSCGGWTASSWSSSTDRWSRIPIRSARSVH
jgi:hypothetical protein